MITKKKDTKKTGIEEYGVDEISEITPHNKALYEAGKTMLIESISTGREFCKFMISTSTGAIPVYLGILTFLLPKNYSINLLEGIILLTPSILFLISTIFFVIGFLPVSSNFSLDIIEEIETERNQAIQRRMKFIKIGFTLFVIGALNAIIDIVFKLGTK